MVGNQEALGMDFMVLHVHPTGCHNGSRGS